jgi:hypothetical protein
MHVQNEPWYLAFNADVEFRIAMTPEDLKKAGLGDFPHHHPPSGGEDIDDGAKRD